VERYQFSEIVDAFVDAAKEVVTQILGVEVVGQQDGAGDALITFDGVVAVVGFSGAFSGRLLLGIPEPLSVALFHALGGETLPSPDEELFAASEFGNLERSCAHEHQQPFPGVKRSSFSPKCLPRETHGVFQLWHDRVPCDPCHPLRGHEDGHRV